VCRLRAHRDAAATALHSVGGPTTFAPTSPPQTRHRFAQLGRGNPHDRHCFASSSTPSPMAHAMAFSRIVSASARSWRGVHRVLDRQVAPTHRALRVRCSDARARDGSSPRPCGRSARPSRTRRSAGRRRLRSQRGTPSSCRSGDVSRTRSDSSERSSTSRAGDSSARRLAHSQPERLTDREGDGPRSFEFTRRPTRGRRRCGRSTSAPTGCRSRRSRISCCSRSVSWSSTPRSSRRGASRVASSGISRSRS
jgi:hypothetical protein